MKQRQCNAETLTEVSCDHSDLVRQDIMAAISRANTKAESRAHKVQKYKILPSEFGVVSGELTPTLKIKRHVIVTKYEPEINELYN